MTITQSFGPQEILPERVSVGVEQPQRREPASRDDQRLAADASVKPHERAPTQVRAELGAADDGRIDAGRRRPALLIEPEAQAQPTQLLDQGQRHPNLRRRVAVSQRRTDDVEVAHTRYTFETGKKFLSRPPPPAKRYNRPMATKHDTMSFLNDELAALDNEGRRVSLRILQSPQEPVSVIDGKKVVNLTSNNYLDLANHPKLREAAKKAIDQWGVGTAAVRPIIGTMSIHDELERRLAAFKKQEAAVVFQSGFTVNVACCQSLMTSEQDLLISDELNHASIIDGARLAKAARKIYKHRDMKHLKEILESPESRKARRKMIVTDGVFSMDGDVAPLPEIMDLADKYEAFVMVDDAHASGVMGKNGRGTPDHFGLSDRVQIQIGTLSKAVGAVGGYVAGSKQLRDYLISTARPFIFSSSHPPSVIATCLAALDIMEGEPQRIETLWKNARYFKEGLKKAGFDTGASETPITPVMVGDTAKAKKFSARLFEEGVFALSIVFPIVARGKERLRTIVSSGHAQKDLDFALEKFAKVGRELGIVR